MWKLPPAIIVDDLVLVSFGADVCSLVEGQALFLSVYQNVTSRKGPHSRLDVFAINCRGTHGWWEALLLVLYLALFCSGLHTLVVVLVLLLCGSFCSIQ